VAGLVSSEDEVSWSQQLGLSQESFGVLVAGESEMRLIGAAETRSLYEP